MSSRRLRFFEPASSAKAQVSSNQPLMRSGRNTVTAWADSAANSHWFSNLAAMPCQQKRARLVSLAVHDELRRSFSEGCERLLATSPQGPLLKIPRLVQQLRNARLFEHWTPSGSPAGRRGSIVPFHGAGNLDAAAVATFHLYELVAIRESASDFICIPSGFHPGGTATVVGLDPLEATQSWLRTDDRLPPQRSGDRSRASHRDKGY